MVNTFGSRIRALRENANLPQRVVAAALEIDTPMLSKIERGERKAKKDQVGLLANFLAADVNDLSSLWLADQLLEILQDEEMALRALQVAEEEVEYKLMLAKEVK